MKRTWTIIGVRDVPSSFKWYQSLFGQLETPPSHDDWGQILNTDGTVLLCLHQWGVHEHPSLMSPGQASPGNGFLLFFRVDDYKMVLQRARALADRFEEEPHVNPNTQTTEFSLRDPDGYYVTISALSAPQRRRAKRRRPNKRSPTDEDAGRSHEGTGTTSAHSQPQWLIVRSMSRTSDTHDEVQPARPFQFTGRIRSSTTRFAASCA